MDLSTMRAAVRRWVQRRTDIADSEIDDAINNAYQALVVGRFTDASRRTRILRFPSLQRRATTQLVYGSDTYDLPEEAYSVSAVRYDQDGNGRWLRLRYIPYYNYANRPRLTGMPFDYTTYQRQIVLYPSPADTLDGNDLEIWYYARPAELTTSVDEPVIPDAWHPLIVLRAVADVASQYGMHDVAELADQRFAVELSLRQMPNDTAGDELLRGDGGA